MATTKRTEPLIRRTVTLEVDVTDRQLDYLIRFLRQIKIPCTVKEKADAKT